ncbi:MULTISPECIES: helix-turn-helix transcriptional regulator [Streptomyces]|uniref:helix-turn-helix transcriptional regulator n=1 Tax=Streptomyces TaxID=1883 RepID=UPI0004BD2413|nr:MULTISPECIES: LuxR C-terminal-related transcriptional regulator [unclassified Streptomyces]KOU02476.1 LuxR family transcriptional regulator [Streptomyces sp. NRRL F-4711]KOX30167.1 LuxR family transcriptional regulator [Streptomyces sp. NRRL F-4707]KOX45351.1 LuxR family transcriptional regulator [Streptomyces sp. NRRL F-7442]NEB63814.1 helix-turn-helix transcriptional regulator [Streptomyces diastaticus]
MTAEANAPHTEHGPDELCPAGALLYRRALGEGRVTVTDATATPCLVDFGLLQPSLDDPDRLDPVAPVVGLHRLLRMSQERIADERRREERLTETFTALMRTASQSATGEASTLRVLSGKERIDRTIGDVMAVATDQVLTIQPHSTHVGPHPRVHEAALARDQALLDRGGRIRTLYQHTLRHAPTVLARYELLRGDVEARTLDEVTERLIVVDRTVAFIPASADRSLALEVRHPALIAYFVNTFDRLWHLATPMHPQAVHQPTLNGITPRQRAIAALLIEGHTDSDIADRLGMNVRTARVHIAKLAATLGSESRAQLGYLIGQSGILDREG